MKKKFNTIIELLPDLVHSFMSREMLDICDEQDIIDYQPTFSKDDAEEFIDITNQVLNDFFGFDDEEACYGPDSLSQNSENPINFWKSYIECFYNFELVDAGVSVPEIASAGIGIYMCVDDLPMQAVNKRFAKRSFDGIHLPDFKITKDCA